MKILVNSMIKPIKIGALLLITIGFFTTVNVSNAQDYEPWTGAVPGANINLGNEDELVRIRNKINEGETAEAVRLAQRYVDSLLINERSGRTSNLLYDGYNALCISLTNDEQFTEAMTACNTAIEHSPNRWQALNSRGSLNYVSANFSAALQDYQRAYEMSPNVTRIKKIIEHNIEISRARVAGN